MDSPAPTKTLAEIKIQKMGQDLKKMALEEYPKYPKGSRFVFQFLTDPCRSNRGDDILSEFSLHGDIDSPEKFYEIFIEMVKKFPGHNNDEAFGCLIQKTKSEKYFTSNLALNLLEFLFSNRTSLRRTGSLLTKMLNKETAKIFIQKFPNNYLYIEDKLRDETTIPDIISENTNVSLSELKSLYKKYPYKKIFMSLVDANLDIISWYPSWMIDKEMFDRVLLVLADKTKNMKDINPSIEGYSKNIHDIRSIFSKSKNHVIRGVMNKLSGLSGFYRGRINLIEKYVK